MADDAPTAPLGQDGTLGHRLPWPDHPAKMSPGDYHAFVQEMRDHPPPDLTPGQVATELDWGRGEARRRHGRRRRRWGSGGC
jgi:hypothetical protein